MDLKAAIRNPEGRVRRRDVNGVLPHLGAVFRDFDREFRIPADNFMKNARAFRVEMRDDNDRDARFGRHSPEEALERFDPAGGRSDTNNRKG